MKLTPTVTMIVLLSAGGCRTANTRYEAESLTHRYSPASRPGDSRSEPVAGSAESVPPPTVMMQPVMFQDVTMGQGPHAAPEPLPVPEGEGLPQSDLTLRDLEGIALRNSPVLAEAAARVEAAQGDWVQVGLPPNPRMGYSGEEIGDAGSAGQQGGFVAQQFVTGGKLALNRQVAAWEIQRLENELQAFRLRVLTDVRIGYYDVLVAQRRRELAVELVRISEEGVQAAQALFQGEEVSEADPLRARVDADSARIVLQNAVNQQLEAWRRLTAVIGMPDMELQRIEGELKPDDLNVAWQEELRRVLTDSPEIAAAIADVEAAQWSVDRAYAEVIPDVQVQAAVQKNDASGETVTSVQIELPIPLINRNEGRIQRAHAEVAAAERAVDRLAMDLQTRLASAFQRYESARNQVEQFSREGGILANSQRTLQLIRAGYQAEEFGVLELLTAQRTYFQTNLNYLDSLRELSASAMEIRGLLLRGSLSK